jgi:hypothetical protein
MMHRMTGEDQSESESGIVCPYRSGFDHSDNCFVARRSRIVVIAFMLYRCGFRAVATMAVDLLLRVGKVPRAKEQRLGLGLRRSCG